MTEKFYHICFDCKHEQGNVHKAKNPDWISLRDPTGLARDACDKGRINSFPNNIEQCDMFLATEESIVKGIETKGW